MLSNSISLNIFFRVAETAAESAQRCALLRLVRSLQVKITEPKKTSETRSRHTLLSLIIKEVDSCHNTWARPYVSHRRH